jgi:signal transduction histidine kinase
LAAASAVYSGRNRLTRRRLWRPTRIQRFRHGDTAPAYSPGLGIGLSLVLRLAELHGGTAWVEARPGGGASFQVTLPGLPH